MADSRYAADTLIIVTEDDCQDGPDHVDSHRGTAYIVGPYVKQGAVVSTRYSQVNVLRTIEDILGTQHINLNTAFQRPMTDVFDIRFLGQRGPTSPKRRRSWRTATRATTRRSRRAVRRGPMVKPKHDAEVLGQSHGRIRLLRSGPVLADKFNRVLWKGLMGRQALSGFERRSCLSRSRR